MNSTFNPTVQWMADKYDELNRLLFRGRLGACDFELMSGGRGINGRTLGNFSMKGGAKVYRNTRRMFVVNAAGIRVDIDGSNFTKWCKPTIRLNPNYSGTEEAFLEVLAHEMCHYYTYMDGWAPVQAHGREFRDIADIVCSRSDGRFSIHRMLSAESGRQMRLNPEVEARNKRFEQSKKSRMTALFDFRGREVHLTLTTSQSLVDKIVLARPSDRRELVVSSDSRLIDLLFGMGYKSAMRSWRYWDVSDEDFVGHLGEFDCSRVDGRRDESFARSVSRIVCEVVGEFVEGVVDGDDGVATIEPEDNLSLVTAFTK